MWEYLGIEVPDDTRGVLQDTHWAIGAIGYFSTYALGNLISAQIWERVRADLPDLDDAVRARRVRRAARVARASSCTATAASSRRPRRSSASSARRGSTPSRTCATCGRKLGEIYGLAGRFRLSPAARESV